MIPTMSHTDPAVQVVRKKARKIIQVLIRKGKRNEDIAALYGVTAQCVREWRDSGGSPSRAVAEKIVSMEAKS